MQSHYVINVAESRSGTGKEPSGVWSDYEHLFATAPHSIPVGEERKLEHVAQLIRASFPLPRYSVTVTRWECTGHSVP